MFTRASNICHLCPALASGLSHSGFWAKMFCAFFISCMHTTCAVIVFLHELITKIIGEECKLWSSLHSFISPLVTCYLLLLFQFYLHVDFNIDTFLVWMIQFFLLNILMFGIWITCDLFQKTDHTEVPIANYVNWWKLLETPAKFVPFLEWLLSALIMMW
jgi:hypothetical protein